MGRPSLVQQRTDEILDAFERCVAAYGLEGSSLERIAEEAGMKRSILRHYVGNREDLIRALADRSIAKYEASFDEHLTATASRKPVERLLGYLFPSKPVSSTESILVIESLIAAADSDMEIREKMLGYVDRLVSRSAALLQENFPDSSRQRCWAVAYGLVSICFNQESLTPLQPPPKYLKAARVSADILIDSLR